jgi:epoxyqueuosine reductase
LDICPTGAFTASGLLDSRRCISYHTIENRGWVPRELRAAFGARVFGCDDCLAVCPWNRFARESHSILLERRHDLAALSLLDLLRLTQEGFSQVFRATAVKRTKLAGILRNSCIAAGNAWAGQGAGSQPIADLCRLAQYSASPVVRGHAVWAVHRIAGDPATAGDCLAVAKTQESDPQVLAEYHAAGACSVSSPGG